jgi:hypothetical protein
VRQHQRRALHLLDDIGDGKSFARSGDAQQSLVREAAAQSIHELFNRLRLIPGRQVIGKQFKIHCA